MANLTEHSKNIIFRQVCDADLNDIYEYGSQYEVVKYLTWGPHKKLSDAQESCDFLKKDMRSWAIVYDNKMIGSFSINGVNKQLKYLEIGYVLNPKYHLKGIMTYVMVQMVDFIWKNYAGYDVVAAVFESNWASRQLLQKMGFQLEKTFWNFSVVTKKKMLSCLYRLKPGQQVNWKYFSY